MSSIKEPTAIHPAPGGAAAEAAQKTFPPARILGIESSCDETAAAVIENGRALQSSVVATQVDLHAKYGGVFPEVASRQHIRTIYAIVDQALQQAHLTLSDLDAIAVTRGPGLAGSLVVGLNMAKGLALGRSLPLVGVNHLEGHIYSAWVYGANETPPAEPHFPLLALLVSGGHSELVLIKVTCSTSAWGGPWMTRLVRLSTRLLVCWVSPIRAVHPSRKPPKKAIHTLSPFHGPGWKGPGIFPSAV